MMNLFTQITTVHHGNIFILPYFLLNFFYKTVFFPPLGSKAHTIQVTLSEMTIQSNQFSI